MWSRFCHHIPFMKEIRLSSSRERFFYFFTILSHKFLCFMSGPKFTSYFITSTNIFVLSVKSSRLVRVPSRFDSEMWVFSCNIKISTAHPLFFLVIPPSWIFNHFPILRLNWGLSEIKYWVRINWSIRV